MLRLQAICKHYGKRRVLDRLDLERGPGAVVCLASPRLPLGAEVVTVQAGAL